MTISEFIKSAGIQMTVEHWIKNPNRDNNNNMDHWKCVLRARRSQMTIYFSQGFGHNGKAPSAASVLDCLASGALTVDNSQNFEDWASDLGYSPDSRKAEHIFKKVERQSLTLQRFLGDIAYKALLYDVERH